MAKPRSLRYGRRMDTLTRMRAFVAVAEAGGYSAAARKIGKSKALLSKYVRELEDELGALLLNRTTRQISLTHAGEVYLRRGAELIGEIEGLGELVRDQTAATGGVVRLSAPRAFADSPLGSVFTDFAREHGGVELDIDLSDRFVDLVEEGYDLAIRIGVPEDSELIAKRLAPMRLVTIAAPELLDRVGRPAAPADLKTMPCIIDTNRRSPDQWLYRDRDGEPMSVSVGKARIRVNSPVLALRAARKGLGIALVPDFVVDCGPGEVEEVLNAHSWDGAVIQALYPHRRHQTQRVRLLLDFLADWFRERDGK